MGFLKSLFGPSKDEIWRQLSREVEGEFSDGGLFGADRVQVQTEDWIITLDTVTEGGGNNSQTYTRLRAPYINRSGMQFTVYRSGFFSEVGKLFGMQDITVGHADFDSDFIIKGNRESHIRELFANDTIRRLLRAQPRVYFHVADDEGWFHTKFPEGVDELLFKVPGVIKDLGQLRQLFDLFAETLNHLCHLDPAYEDDVQLHLAALRAPGGQIGAGGLTGSNVTLWDGDPPRREAARKLGELKDPRAVLPLIDVLDDSDPLLRSEAIRALGEIGDARAIPALIPTLATPQRFPGEGDDRTHPTSEALRKLGQGDLVDAFAQALRGDKSALHVLDGEYRGPIIQALIGTLDHPNHKNVVRAAQTLAVLNAVEALPDLRERTGVFSGASGEVKQACEEAVATLEAFAALPRSAGTPDPDRETLPRSVDASPPDTETLPAPAGEAL